MSSWPVVAVSMLASVWTVWPTLLTSGALAHRDLLFLDRIPFPRSAFWMGPDLARRLPGFVPLSMASWLVSGTIVGRAMLLLALAVLGIGVGRVIEHLLPRGWRASVVAAVGSGLIISMPFVSTRLSIGHLTTVWALAVLPFLHLAVRRSPRGVASSRASTCSALLGFVSGCYCLVTIGAVAPRGSRIAALGSWFVRNAIWLLPGLFLQAQGFTTLADPASFTPQLHSVADVLGLFVGRGYWDGGAEAVRGHDLFVVVVVLALVALAAFGRPLVPTSLWRAFAVGMVVGFGVPLAAAAPFTERVVSFLVTTPVGAPFREPHRLLGLGLVPFVVLACLGLHEVTRRAAEWVHVVGAGLLAATAVCLLALAMPTVHHRLDPLQVPAAWNEAADIARGEGGVVMALPWSEYVLLDIDHPRVVYSPLPDLFGNETLASSDPQLGESVNESADPRAPLGARTAAILAQGGDASTELAALGVRFVAVLKVEAVRTLDLSSSPGLEPAMRSASLDLYRVVVTPQRTGARPLPFVLGDEPAGFDVPWTWGWVGGGGLRGRTEAGLIAGRTGVFFLPAVLGLAQLLQMSCLLIAPNCGARALRSSRNLLPSGRLLGRSNK